MKRVLALLLSLVMLLSLCSVFASAANNEPEKKVIVLLRGYATSVLYDMDNGKQVWPITDLGQKVAGIIDHYRLSKILPLIKTRYTENLFMRVLADGVMDELFAPLAVDDNGNSINNIKAYPYNLGNIEMARGIPSTKYYTYKYLQDNGYDKVIIKEAVCDQLIANGYDAENIFIYNYDFRASQEEHAAAVSAFIDNVKAATGVSKVDLFGTSHGGQQVASYLSFYGYKNDVNRAVMVAPAVGGTSVAGELLSGNLSTGATELKLSVVELFLNRVDPTVLKTVGKFVGIDQELVNDTIKYVVDNYLDSFANVKSLWDFVPNDYYAAAKAYCKSSGIITDANATLIAGTDTWHNTMANYRTMFKETSAKPFIIANYGTPGILNSNNQSDLIIDLKNATGAEVADYGKTFEDGRIFKAETGFLPETTYYINGGLHGKFEEDKYCMSLLREIYNGNLDTPSAAYPISEDRQAVEKTTAEKLSDAAKKLTTSLSKSLSKIAKNSKLLSAFAK